MGIETVTQSQKLKRYLLVAAICVILVSSVAIVDLTSAGYEYEVDEPSFSHDFPETVFFYNISEGVTSNIFSFIIVLPTNHSGHHHIIPTSLSLVFWFRDATDGSDLSSFIYDVFELSWNSSLSLNTHDYDRIHTSESDWWAPSQLHYVINDQPDVNHVRFGLAFELLFVNSNGEGFDGHELNVRLDMNVTYSRWWYGLSLSKSHQTVEYSFNLPDDGITALESLEYGLPS